MLLFAYKNASHHHDMRHFTPSKSYFLYHETIGNVTKCDEMVHFGRFCTMFRAFC